jgi:autotransporter-associated beta strand protein
MARADRRATLVALTVLSAAELLGQTAHAGDIDTSKPYYLASGLSGSLNPVFKGGTLRIDSNTTLTQDFSVTDVTGNTVDAYGNTATFSGVLSGAGAITFADSIGGGKATLSGINTYTGNTTISGGTLALSGSGSIATSSQLINNAIFDISATTSGASVISLSGSDASSVVLGSKTLTIAAPASTTYAGVISGTGKLVLTSGVEYLTGENTYTGGTKISSGSLYIGNGTTTGSIIGDVFTTGSIIYDHSDDVTLANAITGSGTVGQAGSGSLIINSVQLYTGPTVVSAGRLVLTGDGNIAASSIVTDNSDFDISGTNADVSLKSLSGSGTLELGTHTLTVTAATATFAGAISGSGGLVVAGGTETLSGTNTYTGVTIVNSGAILQLGNAGTTGSVIGGVVDNGTVAFNYSSGTVGNTITGTGGVSQAGSGTTTLTAAQGYTGVTTISAGTLALAQAADISSSSGVVDNSTFDISAMTSAVSIKTLSGSGAAKLGSQTLVLTAANGVYSGAISGTGGLEIDGGGETLSGSNGFSGTTNIASGSTLYLSGNGNISNSSHVNVNGTLDIAASTTTNAIISLAGNGKVSLGANALTVSVGTDTFAGTISGDGGLIINGGTETLTGTNTYLGTTAVYGTLKLVGSGSIASSGGVQGYGTFDISGTASGAQIKSLNGLGSLVLGAQDLTITAGAGTYTGVISGTGGLVVTGGTQVLSGDNTYTGGTTITGGTLQLGSGYGSGSIVGDVLDNGTLAFNSSSGSFSGVISGTGSVSQASGTVILFGANTYTGGTIITGGTLQIGNGGTTGSIGGDVTDNGTFAFDHSDNVSFGGTISGTGGVSQLGTGTFTLTGTNTYTGTTTIASGGTLALTGNGSIADSSQVVANGVLDLSALASGVTLHSLSGTGSVALGAQTLTLSAASGNFSGVIGGTGGVTLTGGTETLAGDNTYTGLTLVNAGTLYVDGNSTSSASIQVASGATLGGTGTVSGVTIASGGRISAGDASSVGKLHIAGALQLGSTAMTNVNVSSSGASEIVIDNAAALGGTLTVTSNGGYALGQKFTILSASGGLTGALTLATTTSTGGNFIYALTQDANNVYLQVNLAKLTSFLPSTATANERATSLGIDTAIAAGSTLPTAFEQLGNLSATGLASTLDELSGEIGADTVRAAEAVQAPFVSAIFDHMDDVAARFTPGVVAPAGGTWTKIYAGSGKIGGDADMGSHGLSEGAWGLAAGADWNYGRNITLGAAVSYGRATERLAGDLGTGSVNAFQLGGYGLFRWSSHFYGALAVTLGADSLRTLRTASADTLESTATALGFGVRYETGLRLSWGTPYVAARGAWLSVPAYDEDATAGAGTFALHYDARTSSRTGVELGLKESGSMKVFGGTLQLSGRVAWTHDFTNTYDAKAVFQNVVGSDFTVQGVQEMADAGLLSLGADYRMSSGLGFRLGFDSQVSQNSQSYYGDAGLTFRW